LKTSSSALRKTPEASCKSDLHEPRCQRKPLAYCDRWILFFEQLVILTSGLLPLFLNSVVNLLYSVHSCHTMVQ